MKEKTNRTKKKRSCDEMMARFFGSPELINIPPRAFGGNELKNITLSDSLISIGYSAFTFNCLKELKIPNSVTLIEGFAFSNNELEIVELSLSLLHIGEAAFAFNRLKKVKIPDSVTYIGDRAFSCNPGLILYVKKNSEAHRYAIREDILHEVLD